MNIDGEEEHDIQELPLAGDRFAQFRAGLTVHARIGQAYACFRGPMKSLALVALVFVAILAAACGGSGLPDKDGIYPVQSHSIVWDGDQYRFSWADSAGSLHQAKSKDLKLVQDDQTFLQVQNHNAVLHVVSTEPLSVIGQDSRGQYSDSWFPFLAGATLGNVLSNSRSPGYYYPPTNTYGRGDQVDGSVTTTSPKPPDYSTVHTPPNAVHPATGSVAGQNSGTGGGNAATNKLGGSSNSNGSAASVGGQAGGTGNGSAAGNKAGSGTSSQSGGSTAPKSGGSAPRSGGGSGGGSRGHR